LSILYDNIGADEGAQQQVSIGPIALPSIVGNAVTSAQRTQPVSAAAHLKGFKINAANAMMATKKLSSSMFCES
jgi:hypothetical protein